ncbi:MAG: hypothetical protein HKN22_04890 [Bacteroidia bacterium]|nr:hypothetical protein [Bacteroidia bacterium]
MNDKRDNLMSGSTGNYTSVSLRSVAAIFRLKLFPVLVLGILCLLQSNDLLAQFANDQQLLSAVRSQQDHNIDNYMTVLNNDQVFVKWTSANEIEDCIYVIERSHDATEYNAVGVKEGISTSIELFYSWIDKEPLTGYAYYRIKKITKNGDQYFSKVNSVFNISPGTDVTAKAK